MSIRTPASTSLLAPPERPSKAGAARSGAPPGESPFAMLLKNDRARTAAAEGPRSEAPREDRGERRDSVPAEPRRPEARAADTPQAVTQPEAPTEPRDPATDPALGSPVSPEAEPVAEAPVAAVPFTEIVAEAAAPVIATTPAP